MITQYKWQSSMAKVFPDREPEEELSGIELSFLANEKFSLQCAYRADGAESRMIRVKAEGKLARYVRIRKVCLMPSRYPERSRRGSAKPGLFPDLLLDTQDGLVRLYPDQWQSLFLTVDTAGAKEEEIPYGEQTLALAFLEAPDQGCLSGSEKNGDGKLLFRTQLTLQVKREKLCAQKMYHTEWFHADCLADYYGETPWSERYWRILENFLEHYAGMGMNMILVPAFTPPLDTAAGGERTAVQLVEVYCGAAGYRFGFDRLARYVKLCQSKGIAFFEIAHLFTQWGAKAAPNIYAHQDGRLLRLFGWETDSCEGRYLDFLRQFLTALTGMLDEFGLRGKVFFHLSDEPEEADREHYARLRREICPFLNGYPVLDAVSRYSFYRDGLVERPVPGVDHLEPFLQTHTPHLWTYYCNAQDRDVPNRFFSMPSARNRVLGVLLYYLDIEGFLHWGYNFYNSQYSLKHIDPFATTDADGAFPSGDAFLVYPGKDGRPIDSLRMAALAEAMQDVRALQTLEERIGREETVRLIEKTAGGKLSMTKYPAESGFLLRLRAAVNRRISYMEE